MKFCSGEVVLLTLWVWGVGNVLGSQRFRKRVMPLKAAPSRNNAMHSKRRIGCYFDGKHFELDEEWHPDLGEPFGVMGCIKCKCIPVQKKKKIIGRVTCKNFADKCPKPKCENPISQPDQCCKVCPNEKPIELNIFGENPEKGDYQWDSGYTELMAILTGRFQNPPVLTEGVGRAYLTLYQGNVHYSIVVKKLEEIPRSIQILNENDAVLFERTLSQEQPTERICGVWEKLPRLYLRLLRRQRLRLVVFTEKQINGALGGVILKPKGLNKEVFSGLFSPAVSSGAKTLGYGGVAVIDVQGGNSLDISVWLNASIDITKNLNSPVFLHLEKNDGRRKQLKSVEAEMILKDGLFGVEAQIRLGSTEQRWLSRGRLLLSLTSEFLIPQELVASVTPKQSCDVYQAVLSSNNHESDSSEQFDHSAGVAFVEVTKDTSFKYMIHVSGLNDSFISGIEIDRKLKKKNRRRLVAESREQTEFVSGSTKGFFRRQISFRNVDFLFKEKLHLELSTKNSANNLRGQLKRLLYSNSVQPDVKEPILLTGSDNRKSTVSGILWAGRPPTEFSKKNGRTIARETCSFSYTVHISGLTNSKPKDLQLSLWDPKTREVLHKFDRELHGENQRFVSQELDYLAIYGNAHTLPGFVWKLLNFGNVVFRIATSGDSDSRGFLSGNFSMENTCWKQGYMGDRFVSEDAVANTVARLECFYQDVTYKDGDSWHALHTPCTMCSCQRGKVRCDPVLCPLADCPTSILLPGDCCRTCPLGVSPIAGVQTLGGETDDPGCFWGGDRRWHAPGTAWHPYIPPFGFSRCALCTCQPHSQEVTCSRTSCPKLECHLSLQYREKATDCCPKCRAMATTTTTTAATTVPTFVADDTAGKCFFQNRWFANGSNFTPSIAHVAHLKCVRCTCKNSRVSCRKYSTCSTVKN